MPYKVTVAGQSMLTDDFTLDEAEGIEDDCGTPWIVMNPFRSAKVCKAILVRVLMRDRSEEDARKFVRGLTLKDILKGDMLEVVDDDLPGSFEDGLPAPKAEGGPSTSGSSGADSSSTGPQT